METNFINMNVQELRIGNYLYSEPLSIPRLQISSDGITKITAYGIYAMSCNDQLKWEPIPLTDELSLKCGFINKSGWKGMIFAKVFCDEESEFVFELMEGNLTVYVNDVIIYLNKKPTVHELQNLWKMLNGKELKITL